MKHNVFIDTIKAVTVYRRMHRYAQVYSTEFGWSRVHPTKKKGDTHENLRLFFMRYDVPPKIVMDGLKEQKLGNPERNVKRRI